MNDVAAPATEGVTASVASFLARAARRPLPREIAEKTRHHVLDSLAAAVSGARLRAGQAASRYVRALGGARQATVIGSRLLTSTVNAALANGMSAHADETDDSHAPSLTHPGCAIVPAALAVAEACGASGRTFLRAVAAGYDVGCRATMAFDAYRLFEAGRGTHAIGGVFGAAAAACVAAGLDARGAAHALSYAAQQASGVTTWTRDRDHVEKAFVFGGMPARDGVAAATMIASGMSAVDDALEQDAFFARFAPGGDAGAMSDGLGTRFEIARAAIKKWSVGSPIQAALDALGALGSARRIAPDAIAAITVEIPEEAVKVVDGRAMPDVNLQHLVALYLVDGALPFAASHDRARMADPAVAALRARVRLVGSRALSEARPRRQAIVKVPPCCGSSAVWAPDRPDYPARHVMGAGPFRFVEHVPGAHWAGRRFERYHKPGEPYLDGFRVIDVSGTAMVNALAGGQTMADFRGVSPAERDRIVATRGERIRILEAPQTAMQMLSFNTQRPPFDDARVRRALSLAIDRWGGVGPISRLTILGYVGGMLRPGYALARSEQELTQLPGFARDIAASRAEARRLLAAAGVPNLAFTYTNRDIYTPLGIFLIDQWRQVGVAVRHEQLDTPPFFAARRDGNFAVIVDSSNEFVDEPSIQLARFLSHDRAPLNISRYVDRTLDALFDRQARATDAGERLRLIRDFEARMLTEARTVPLFWGQRIIPLASELRGFTITPSYYLGQDLATLWLRR